MAYLHRTRTFDEHRWVIRIRRTLTEPDDDDDDLGLPISIFTVPNPLKSTKPELYTPQEVSIGPYHHSRPELHDMERYKLDAARKVHKNHRLITRGLKFLNIVEQLIKLETRVRAVYNKHIDLNGETLGWMMAIDSAFVLEFLQVYAVNEIFNGGRALSRVSSRLMSNLVDRGPGRNRTTAHNAVLRDVVMLENQIPMFVLRTMLGFQLCSSEVEADIALSSMLLGLCKELSPFKTVDIEEPPVVRVSECAHLLDFLYQTIVPDIVDHRSDIVIESNIDHHIPTVESRDLEGDETSSRCNKVVVDYANRLAGAVSNLFSKLKRLLSSKSFKVILKLPWKIVSDLPGISTFKQPIEYLFFTEPNEVDSKTTGTQNPNGPPLVEEIAIPSVSDLSKSGINFVPTNGSLSNIEFDPKNHKFYLPVITLDTNSEVVMWNIVAYEARNGSGPLVFTRYTELMNGIIDTDEDAKYLREKGIIVNHLKSDGEVAELWNGMSKSIRLTKVGFIDKAIEDVNKYYSGRWRVRIGNFFEDNVLGSWQMLTFFTAVVVLLLLLLQAFCSVFSCIRKSTSS